MMHSQESIVLHTEAYVKEELAGEPSGHDWWHIHRVRQTALAIAEAERADAFICEMSALLHDLADEKLNDSKEAGMEKVHEWLCSQDVDPESRKHIEMIISTMSYAGGNGPAMETIEGKVVQDADRLDAIGAIGIARAFAYGGAKGHILHDPDSSPREITTAEEYRTKPATAINHFYEKLFKLKDLMNTSFGRKIAERRTERMHVFLEAFYAEWEGRQ